jgi:hypothetical protein
MNNINVKHSIIKIVGLLGEFPTPERISFQFELLKNGYIEDTHYADRNNILKDVFYPDFRGLMFVKNDDKKEDELLSRRFYSEVKNNIVFVKRDRETGKILDNFNSDIAKSEIFLFGDQIGLFSLTLKIEDDKLTIPFISNIINQCRNFDAEININLSDENVGPRWHEWISKNYLCGTKLRDENKKIKVDEFSGSKFKVFSVFDSDISQFDRKNLLFDLGTSSPLNSSVGEGNLAPHPEYFNEVMKNKISIFNNWDSLCLFDSFTTIGNNILTYERQKWEDSYFRIYLFRLFFKYNLYRYNSDLHYNTVKLRNQFDKFLNNYNLSHISFNFLPNEIFNKIGDALRLEEELVTFQNRINRISSAIQEEKQSRTNALLQFVSVLGGFGAVQPVIDLLSLIKIKHLSIYYTLLVLIIFGIGTGILFLFFPNTFNKIKQKLILKKNGS